MRLSGDGSKLPDNAQLMPSSGQAYPVAMFSSVMGFCGLGLSWRAAAQVLGAPPAIGEVLVGLAALLFVLLAGLYLLTCYRMPGVIVAEFRSPGSSSHFGCLTIALLLLAVAALPYAPKVTLALWLVGAAGQFLLFVTLMGRWISEPTDLADANPSWLIPIVGNATATFAGMPLGFHETSWFLLAIGSASWLAFLPLLLNRLIFHSEPLTDRLAPSLAILVSAPAVNCLAWLQVTGRVDEIYRLLLFTAVLFATLVVRLWRLAARSPISIAWWGYTFPSAALATALIRYRQQVLGPGPTVLAWLGLGVASLVVAVVVAMSLRTLVRNYACGVQRRRTGDRSYAGTPFKR